MRRWAASRNAAAAWRECERADWLLWWVDQTPVNSDQEIVLAACACARTLLVYVSAGELRPLRAIEAAEMWARNPTEANLSESLAAESAAAEPVKEGQAKWAVEPEWVRAEAHNNMCTIIRQLLVPPFRTLLDHNSTFEGQAATWEAEDSDGPAEKTDQSSR